MLEKLRCTSHGHKRRIVHSLCYGLAKHLWTDASCMLPACCRDFLATGTGSPPCSWPTVATWRQDMKRQRAAAAAEQLAALAAAAEDMQLARDSEQLALALALTQTGSASTADSSQVPYITSRCWAC